MNSSAFTGISEEKLDTLRSSTVNNPSKSSLDMAIYRAQPSISELKGQRNNKKMYENNRMVYTHV